MLRKMVFITSLTACAIVIFQAIYFYKSFLVLSLSNQVALKQLSDFYANQVLIGDILSLVLLVIYNIYAYASKLAKRLFLPLLFFGLVKVLNAYEAEAIFHFKKENGLWDGGFSLGLIGAGILIAIAALVVFINYLILQYFIKKRRLVVT